VSARIRTYLEVLYVLAASDLQVRYGRGGLRVMKWLLDPIAALGVYLVLVALVLDRSTDAIGLSIACAVVPFQFIVTSAINALGSVGARGSIIVNMRFPRILLPVSAAATESAASSASLILLPVMMVVYGVEPTTALLWFPVALAVTIALAAALTYPASLVGLWYPEYQGFAISLIRTLFFLAPGLVALDQITGTTRELLPFNPLTGVFEAFRDTFLYGHAPAAWELLSPLAAAAIVLALALPLYRREQPELAKLVG
jgi:lipopolysaccharide transport system permease protein